MRNHIYEVMWNYPDGKETGWRDLHQYIVVYNSNSELGKVIDEEIMDSDTAHFARVDEALMKAFDIRDEDVAFYLGENHEPTEEEMIKAVEADGDIIITEVLGKYYSNDDEELNDRIWQEIDRRENELGRKLTVAETEQVWANVANNANRKEK